jgi:AcrR family transcriptional regulator
MAQALGVTHSTLIRQFASKDGLLAEVVEYVRDRSLTQLSKLDGAQSTADLTRAFWRLLDDPRERRQFLLLTEIYTLAQRDWGRYSSVLKSSANDFRRPIETLLVRDGLSPHRATVIATALLAQIRGLQLDLIATGDRDRVNDAFSAVVDALLPSTE